jgi:hypothetical protein
LIARETVAIEKPACAATSLMVGVMRMQSQRRCKRFRCEDYRNCI